VVAHPMPRMLQHQAFLAMDQPVFCSDRSPRQSNCSTGVLGSVDAAGTNCGHPNPSWVQHQACFATDHPASGSALQL
jgi:hypothetical protein